MKREWEMQDRDVKRAKQRLFFQEKLPLQTGPTGKDKRTDYISDLPYFPPFRLLSHSVTKQNLWPERGGKIKYQIPGPSGSTSLQVN